MKLIDDSSKKVTWSNRNYFWSVSIVYIALNIILFAILGRNNLLWDLTDKKWTVLNGIKEWLISVGNVFTHNDWNHVLFNMLAVLPVAIYIERKVGSFNFAYIIIVLSLLGSALTSMYAGLIWAGSSVVYFALYGYALVDYLFSLRKVSRNKVNVILGAIVLFIMLIIFGGYEASNGIHKWSFEFRQLIYNAGHYLGFLVGVIISLIIQIVKFQANKINKLQ